MRVERTRCRGQLLIVAQHGGQVCSPRHGSWALLAIAGGHDGRATGAPSVLRSGTGFRPHYVQDWGDIHRELARKGVTLQLVWEEYKQAHPDGYAYSGRGHPVIPS